jgi:hypothetical protein
MVVLLRHRRGRRDVSADAVRMPAAPLAVKSAVRYTVEDRSDGANAATPKRPCGQGRVKSSPRKAWRCDRPEAAWQGR